MEEFIWLLHRKKENGLVWAVTGSFLVHGLMFALMVTTQIFFPPTGESPRLDVVWLYSALLRDQPQEAPPQEVSLPEAKETASLQRDDQAEPLPAEADDEEPVVVAPVAHAKLVAPAVSVPPPAARREPPAKVEAVRNDVPVREELRFMEEGKGAVRPPPPAAKPPEKAPAVPKASAATASVLKNITTSTVAQSKVVRREPRKAEQVRAAERPAPKVEPVQAKKDVPIPRQEKRQAVAIAPREKAMPVVPPRVTPSPRKENPPAVVANPKDVRTAITPSQPASSPARPAAPALPKPAVPAGATTVAKAEAPSIAQPVVPAAPKPSAAATGQKAAAPVPAPAKGIVEAPVTGDLKLELTGKNRSLKGAKITVLFRDYPRSRRGKTMVKAEALRRRQIHPRLARPAENTLQAVVAVAAEGVYEFWVESESGGAVEAECVARFYEKTGRAKNKSLGTRTVGNKERITRVLMPEGIIWEDDSAFSGSMEDSDSVTKFNSETGLVWKEYREE